MVYSPCRNERLSYEGGKAMSAKRRDKKNRILRSGESQTKDGRYKYTFYEGGKQRAFYSWKLEPTDRLPAGRRDCVALRDQIADYKRQHDRGVAFRGDDYTVYELTRRYVDLKWIRTGCRWWRCTWKSIFSTSLRNITKSTGCRCRRPLLMYAGTPTAARKLRRE